MDWFAQLQLDVPALDADWLSPGTELDTAAGIDYKGFSLGQMRISPLGAGDFFRADQRQRFRPAPTTNRLPAAHAFAGD